jgi:acetyl esterase/lipase
VDRDRIGVHGGSAGGGLAAAVALLARDRAEVALAFQVLESPMLDDRQATRSSQTDGLPIWTREANAFGWRSYLGSLYGTGDVPYTAAAARAADLGGSPPALVTVGSVDGFLERWPRHAFLGQVRSALRRRVTLAETFSDQSSVRERGRAAVGQKSLKAKVSQASAATARM